MKALLDCMAIEHSALLEYVQLLDDEARTLTEGRYRLMPAMMDRKTALARQISELDRERLQLQRQAGFDPQQPTPPGQERLAQAWQQLQASANRARDGNHRNGTMVHTLLDFTRQAIAVMQGGSRPLYGQDGRHPGKAGAGKALAQG